MKAPQNLLIIRTDRIGDVVLSLPMAGIIKKHLPGCKVAFLSRNYTKGLVNNHPDVDETIVLKEENGKPVLFGNVSLIKKYDFDAAIIVYPTFFLALIIFLSGIKTRIGTGYRWYSFLFTNKIYSHRKYADKHELEFNVELLKQIGINENINAGTVKFNLTVNKEAAEKVNNIFRENGIDDKKPVIIFHPGSGGSAVDLPIEKFKKLVTVIDNSGKFHVVLTGSKTEKNICEEIKSSDNAKNFAGLFDLPELVALINRADIFVANSTGPLHIAAALGKSVIGFYPKIQACSAERWGPYSTKSFIFTPGIDCSNCTREQCEQLNCMNSINLNGVFESIEGIYRNLSLDGEIHV